VGVGVRSIPISKVPQAEISNKQIVSNNSLKIRHRFMSCSYP
jgi:hypothetical protein